MFVATMAGWCSRTNSYLMDQLEQAMIALGLDGSGDIARSPTRGKSSNLSNGVQVSPTKVSSKVELHYLYSGMQLILPNWETQLVAQWRLQRWS